jgi:D-threo-aldose 1-dehydrogenase
MLLNEPSFVRAVADACERHDATLPHAAIRFPLRHPAVASVVAGIRDAAEARSDSRWASTPLPGALWDCVEKIVSDHQEGPS